MFLISHEITLVHHLRAHLRGFLSLIRVWCSWFSDKWACWWLKLQLTLLIKLPIPLIEVTHNLPYRIILGLPLRVQHPHTALNLFPRYRVFQQHLRRQYEPLESVLFGFDVFGAVMCLVLEPFLVHLHEILTDDLLINGLWAVGAHEDEHPHDEVVTGWYLV